MEIKVNAIVIKAVDYKDSDRILTLYSLEYGKIVAGIKGVRKSGAKLKFASEPFCFAEYILVEKGGRLTVKNASYIDTFYNLRLSMEKYYTASVILDFLNLLTEEKVQDTSTFKVALDGIKNICYGDDERQFLAQFLLSIVSALGYGIENSVCHDCKCVVDRRVFFCFSTAEFSCEECRKEGFTEIMLSTYLAFCALKNGQKIEDKSAVDKVIKFLLYYLNVKTEVRLKSGEELFKLDE